MVVEIFFILRLEKWRRTLNTNHHLDFLKVQNNWYILLESVCECVEMCVNVCLSTSVYMRVWLFDPRNIVKVLNTHTHTNEYKKHLFIVDKIQ